MAHIKDIIGYKKEVEKLELICDFLKNTNKYIKFCVDLPNCLLICGSSGVGKTYMSKALIEDSGRASFDFNGYGWDVNMLKRVFKKAEKAGNAIVFIDDIDYITPNNDCPVYHKLINYLDACEDCDIFVIATANCKDNLPDYLLDEFNSDMIMELGSPKIEEACEIFKTIFDENKIEPDFNINDFCCFAQNWTCSDVELAFNNAARLAIYEGRKNVSMHHLINAGLLLREDVLAEQFDLASAYYEAGHAAVNLLLGGDAAFIVLLGTYGGFFKPKNQETRTYHDKERYYIVCVAGKACEKIFSGTSSIGSYSDLEKVRVQIEDDIKVLASQGFEYFDSIEYNSPAYNDTLAKKVQSDIQKYYDNVK